jgi:hypothetical protein
MKIRKLRTKKVLYHCHLVEQNKFTFLVSAPSILVMIFHFNLRLKNLLAFFFLSEACWHRQKLTNILTS